MVQPTSLSDFVNPVDFIKQAIRAISSADIDSLLAQLPITSEDDYAYDEENPDARWKPGRFHEWHCRANSRIGG